MVSSLRDLSPSLTVSVIWGGRAAEVDEAELGGGEPRLLRAEVQP